MKEETKFLIKEMSKLNVLIKFDNNIIYLNRYDYHYLFLIENYNNRKFGCYFGDRFYGIDGETKKIIILFWNHVPKELDHDKYINVILE